jgi:hypothetical protein
MVNCEWSIELNHSLMIKKFTYFGDDHHKENHMKFYNLFINFKNNPDTYNSVTDILGIKPTNNTSSKFDKDLHDTWWYQITESDDDEPFDFINKFLDIIEPHFLQLNHLQIKRSDIIIWLVYEYEHQCALGFGPEELKRLGENGIALNIDCFDVTHKIK